MNENSVQQESEFVFRRLAETLRIPFGGPEVNGQWWLLIMGVVLVIGAAFVVWMYVKDARAVRWYWAAPLAVLRLSVYLLLALMFLMPAKQDYEKVEKRSRVLVLIDVSDSFTKVSDDAFGSRGSGKPVFRVNRVMEYLSNDQVGFISKLLDKNPVFLYRFGSRLDDDYQLLEKVGDGDYRPIYRAPSALGEQRRVVGSAWKTDEWSAFGTQDFKAFVVRGLSEEGIGKVKAHPAWEGTAIGDAEWSQKWFDRKDEAFPTDLSEDDLAALKNNREKLLQRVEVARSLASATNVPDALLSAINREAGNMVQAVVVFSDGQSNLGSDAVMQDLRVRAKRENIPVFTVAVGSEQKSVAVRITDVQAPDQTPPDEPFKVIVEQDGEGLVGQKSQLFLEVQISKDGTTERIPAELVYAPGEPPHGQAEIVIDPEKVSENLKSKTNPKELFEGEWKIRAVTPRVDGERFADKEHVSEWSTVKVQKKAQRILIVAGAPNRDCQFLITQLLRDKADMSVLIQNQGGETGKINLLEEAERQITRFPDRLRVDDDPTEKPEEKWYNLARYDVIIAFDVDWSKLTPDQISMVRTWVDLQAGGLLFVAGPIFTKQISRPETDDRYRPLNDILPVIPGDIDLSNAKRFATVPWRLDFENLGGDLDFMKIDDERPVEQAWELFFTGREERDEKAPILRGFYNYYPIREMKTVATPVARFPDPNTIKMPDGKAPPWLAVMQYGQGRTAWVGSSEIWRLRRPTETYFERFWTKLTRYLAQGSRRKQTRRGRILMSKEIAVGGYVRLTAQILDPSLKPLPENSEPKVRFRPVELDRYPADIEKLVGETAIAEAKAKYHARFTIESRMSAKKSPSNWEGYFQKAQLTSGEKFPTGTWVAEVDVPSSTDVLKQKFSIRQSNPELDVTRPDYRAMYQLASATTDLQISDSGLSERLQKATQNGVGSDGRRLAFRFGDNESLAVIPECLQTQTKTLRNRGAVVDYWDKGIELTSFMTRWYSDKPMRVGAMLLAVVGLLSLEWLIRKLLKLA